MLEVGKKCVVISCNSLAAVGKLCGKHYKRWQRHKDVDVRCHSGGTEKIPCATKHPLYGTWRSITRVNRGFSVCERWKKFENFVNDVGMKPENVAGFYRKDARGLFEPNNVYWADFKTDVDERKSRTKKMQQWYAENLDYARNAGLKKMYGVTLEWYNAQHERQKGLCAICKKSERLVIKGKIVKLAVDHCHESKKVRGLLCSSCNRAIGLLKHDAVLLRAAIEYLGAKP